MNSSHCLLNAYPVFQNENCKIVVFDGIFVLSKSKIVYVLIPHLCFHTNNWKVPKRNLHVGMAIIKYTMDKPKFEKAMLS